MISKYLSILFLFLFFKSNCQDTPQQKKAVNTLQAEYNPYTSNKMIFVKNKYYYTFQDSTFSNNDLIKKALVSNYLWKNQDLESEITQYNTSRDNQYSSALCGLAFGTAGIAGAHLLYTKGDPFVPFFDPDFYNYPNQNEALTNDMVIYLSVNVIVVCQFISIHHKHQRLSHAKKIANIYNSYVD